MKQQNQATKDIDAKTKQLIESINALSAHTQDSQVLDSLIESLKNRIEGAVENIKVAFQYHINQNISPDV